MERFKKLYTAMEDWVSGLLLTGGLAIIFYSVIMRYVLNKPQTWTDEVATYMVVWGALIGTAVALRNDHHIKVDLLYNFLPPGAQRWVGVFSNLVGVAFCVFFTYAAIMLEARYLHTGQRSTNVMWPLWVIFGVLPITGVMLGARFVEKLYRLLKGDGNEKLSLHQDQAKRGLD